MSLRILTPEEIKDREKYDTKFIFSGGNKYHEVSCRTIKFTTWFMAPSFMIENNELIPCKVCKPKYESTAT